LSVGIQFDAQESQARRWWDAFIPVNHESEVKQKVDEVIIRLKAFFLSFGRHPEVIDVPQACSDSFRPNLSDDCLSETVEERDR
jgi:hypothetical protein